MEISVLESNALNDYRSEEGAVSFYLSVHPDDDFSTYENRLNEFLETAASRLDQFPGNETSLVLDHLEEEAGVLRQEFSQSSCQSHCVFVSNDYQRTIRLPVRLPERIVVSDVFYTHPLVPALAQFERFAVLLFDASRVRLLEFHLGQLIENDSVFKAYQPPLFAQPMNPWEFLLQRQTCYRMDDTLHRHLAFAAETMAKNFKSLGVDKLLLGAPQGLTEVMKRHLPAVLREALAATFIAEIDDPVEELIHKTHKGYLKYRSQKESQITLTLIEEHARKRAVLGVEPVLEALMQGRVRDMILVKDYRLEGYLYPEKHVLDAEDPSPPQNQQCLTMLEPIPRLRNSMIEEALAQHVNIYHLMVRTDYLEEHQVGGFLRF